MTFEQWLYKACEIKSQRNRLDIHELYQSINLSLAKLSYVDNVSPEEYSLNLDQ